MSQPAKCDKTLVLDTLQIVLANLKSLDTSEATLARLEHECVGHRSESSCRARNDVLRGNDATRKILDTNIDLLIEKLGQCLV